MATATHQIVGKRIVAVRTLHAAELEAFRWDRRIPALAISLDDGTEIVAAADPELNGPGAFVVLTDADAELVQIPT